MELLFEFFMNFLNIEKNNILRICFFSKFHVFFTLHAISNIKKKKNWCKKKFGGGGVLNFFFRKTIISHFTFYVIFNIKKIILKSAPSLTG